MADAKQEIQKVIQEGLSINTQDLISKPVGDLTVQEAVYVQSILDVIGKKVEARCKDLKKRLEAEAREHGQDDPEGKGHKILLLAEGGITLQKRVASAPDEDGLKALLDANKLKVQECFDEVKSLQFNAAKLDYLVQAGKLKLEDITPLKKVTFAVLVDKPEQVKLLLEESGKKGKR